MNTYDALAYAIEVLASINIHQYPDGDDAADALTRLREALPTGLTLARTIESLEYEIDHLPDTDDFAETRNEAVADLDGLTALARALYA